MARRARRRRLAVALAAASIALVTTAADAVPTACTPRGYAYAGLQAAGQAFGVTAGLAAVRTPDVSDGHVAAWIGVGGPGEGPHGADEWLQVGINRVAGDSDTLHYELAQPWGTRYVELAPAVPGHRYRVAVLEVGGWRSVWRVWVDGRPASKPIWLPGSHGELTPMAVAESWDRGTPACNRYDYSFRDIALARSPGGAWAPLPRRDTYVLEDPGYRVVRQAANAFVATGTGRAAAGSFERQLEATSRLSAGRSGAGRSRAARAPVRRPPGSTARAR